MFNDHLLPSQFGFYDGEWNDPEGWGFEGMIPYYRKKGAPKGKAIVDPELLKQGGTMARLQ